MVELGRLFSAIKSNFLGKEEQPQEVKAEIIRNIAKLALTFACEYWIMSKRQKTKKQADGHDSEIPEKNLRKNKKRQNIKRTL